MPRRPQYKGKRAKRNNPEDLRDRQMIAWDGEGIKLRGEDQPQTYVLFGCSVAVDDPLVIKSADDSLDFFQIADYACDIADLYPDAFHVGYFFSYDQNMIIQSLNSWQKVALYEKNRVRLKRGEDRYAVQITPGKRIRLTRIRKNGNKSSLVIDDMAAYFATSFLKAYSGLFPNRLQSVAWQKVTDGKAKRYGTTWSDMAEVTEYWQHEIGLMVEMAEYFRGIMYDAGFMLKEWYGPGALANLIRREQNLGVHEFGGKSVNMPPAVHHASKTAYFGGHVEQYHAGLVKGPVYVYDINSAYPSAFAQLPSMRDGGVWRRVSEPTPGVRMGVYRMRYSEHREDSVHPWRPQPLPHRDGWAFTSYPGMVEGWYWSPEAAYAHRYYGAQLLEGWEWWPADKTEFPWAFFEGMYETRLRLKRAGNPMERAFKLGLNSMYGKMAQRAGWNTETNEPPRAHTLPIAGYVTSYCRAMLIEVIAKMDPEQLIAVETDGIFSTQPPEELGLPISEKLGEWSVKQWDELIYVQSGLYLYSENSIWKSKTRGFSAEGVTVERVRAYMESLGANEKWHPLDVPQSERFIGLGSAVSRSFTKQKVNPFKLQALHCRWIQSPRQLLPGSQGKRVHIPEFCPACKEGLSAGHGKHRLIVRSTALKNPMSQPYRLPWEADYEQPYWQALDDQVMNEISSEVI